MDIAEILVFVVLVWFAGFLLGFTVGANYIITQLKKAKAKRTTVQELNPNKWE